MVNIALPKGRLGEKVYGMFEAAGFDCPSIREPGRKLIFENPEKGIRFFWVKPSDVAIYVERGAADLGVAGKDILLEYEPEVYELLDLKTGLCRMAVAAKSSFRDDRSKTLRVATKFAHIARQYYAAQCRDIDIIHLNGSIELAPILGLSDVIVDIVETGTTLKENDLVPFETITPKIFSRAVAQVDVSAVVSEIIAAVRTEGDKALFRYGAQFDKVEFSALEVSQAEKDAAMEALDPAFLDILREAAENIRAFHRQQVRSSFILTDRPGVVMGQKILPIEKVGLYVPGGTAAYPSTVLMDSIPAKIAGCRELVIVTPPGKDGKVPAAILAAAQIAGVDRIFKVGGAQAVAALAYGTESVPKVDKIVGPGNAFVAEAKKQVFGTVAIDMIAGPSEILVLADGTCDARIVAADLLSQAEHDKLASAVLVTDSAELAQAVAEEIERQLSILPREEIARASIENNGKIIVTGDLAAAIDVANALAPEHLELCVDNPFDYLDRITHAGSIFLGKNCPEALGDYLAGPNHTLPTSGTARFSSPLSVDDFVKKSQYTYFTRDALGRVADHVAAFARQEGLEAHARSATVRFEGEES